MKTSIVWFKTDLRLHDNETLIRAIEKSDEIIPVYCLDEAHFKSTTFGFKKTGSFRAQFLLESLIDLDKNLRELGSGLLLLKGKPSLNYLNWHKNTKFKKYSVKRKWHLKKSKRSY